jgi:hypothetical protein
LTFVKEAVPVGYRDIFRRRYEYFLPFIPSTIAAVALLADDGGGNPFTNHAFIITLVGVSVLVCLFITTVKYRRHDTRTALRQYVPVGFIPFTCFIIVMVGTASRANDELIGWLLLPALLAGITFSIVTATAGMVIRLLFQGVVWCIQATRQRNDR